MPKKQNNKVLPEAQIPLSGMEKIYAGIGREHKPGDSNDIEFIDAIYGLFDEYRNTYYREEWQRLDDNVTIYEGTYWGENDAEVVRGDRKPRMATPMITSCIENIKADLMDEMPEAVILPDAAGDAPMVTAKVLTKVVEQELDACDWEGEYVKGVQDFLQDGWCVFEAGHDPMANNGLGGAFIHHVMNKNFMCDPQTPNLQDGRACFVLDIKPWDWFKQHYPDIFPYMTGDESFIETDRIGSTTEPERAKSLRLIEMWVKEFNADEGTTAVHFVRVAGHQVIEDSKLTYERGYYEHGLFPFRICTLYPQKGSALGLGICDLFKDTQRYADKLNAILLENALRARTPRLFIQEGLVDIEDVRDFSREAIEVQGNLDAAVKWMDTQPLPSYLLNFVQMMQQSIKNEAGSNDQSRGQTAGGVTAASAITALQDMSTKRSRMEARELQRGFKECVRMMIEIMREKDIVPREVVITVNGEPQILPFDSRSLYRGNGEGRRVPIEALITIKTSRQTRFSRMAHNELVLQFVNMFQQTADPLIMMEALEMDDKEQILDQIRKAQHGGMLALQQQNAQMQAQLQQMSEELSQYQSAMKQIQTGLSEPSGPPAPGGAPAEPNPVDAAALAQSIG
jgi:hypothetical protein